MLVMREHSVAVGLIFKDELLDINTFTRCEGFFKYLHSGYNRTFQSLLFSISLNGKAMRVRRRESMRQLTGFLHNK